MTGLAQANKTASGPSLNPMNRLVVSHLRSPFPAPSHASYWSAFSSIFGHAPHVFCCRVHYEIHRRSLPSGTQLRATRNITGTRSDSIHLQAVLTIQWSQACAALSSFSGSTMVVDTALESDLEPFQKLRRFEPLVSLSHSPLYPPSYTSSQPSPSISLPPPSPRMPSAHHLAAPESQRSDFIISTNPPNPRSSFRLGDWM